jgi:hypothetical protein
MGSCIFGSAQKAELETFQAAASPFRLGFQTFDGLQPVLVVIVSIDDFQPQGLSISGALILADLIFLTRIYVRIAIIYDRSDSVLEQMLDDGT